MLVRMWNNRNSQSLLVGMKHGTATLRDSLAVSYKTKHTFYHAIQQCQPWYLPKWIENLFPHRNLAWIYIYIYIFFKNFIIIIIIIWLCWVFVAVCRLSLVAASGVYSSLQCTGFSLRWLLLLRSMGSRSMSFSSWSTRASVVAAYGL